jgi:hypothetical protein
MNRPNESERSDFALLFVPSCGRVRGEVDQDQTRRSRHLLRLLMGDPVVTDNAHLYVIVCQPISGG